MIINWELDHVGIVIKDIDNAIKHYERMGIDLLDSPDLKDSEISLLDSPDSLKSCFIQNEAIRIKLIQPVNGDNLFKDYLDSHGEGLNYIGFRTNDLQKEKARLVQIGIPLLNTTKRADGSEMEILFDTRKYGNVIVALFNEPVSFPIFESSEGDLKLWHLGFVVKDIHKFAEFYQTLGFKLLAPPFLGSPSQAVMDRWTLYDKKSPYGRTPKASMKTWMCHLQNRQGSFLISANELVEAEEGHFHEFLDKNGQPSEGVQHIHFLVENLPKELANMVANGFQCVLTQKRPDGQIHESFFDTREVGNICMAMWSGPPSVKAKPIEDGAANTELPAEKSVYDFYKNKE